MNESIHVLIVDDKLPARKGLEALLTMMPRIEVVGQATNGQEAVHLMKKLRPEVVLMDVQMPVMDGLEATRCIKSHWPDVRVIILTMYTTYRSEALAAGADCYLIKETATTMLQNAVLKSHTNKSERKTSKNGFVM
jgi:DNA-binding NarL/FixJ family response regulator